MRKFETSAKIRKMKKILPIIIFFTLAFSGCALSPNLSEVWTDFTKGDNPSYSKGQIIDDLEFMFNTFEDVHPNIYYYKPEKEIDRFKNEIIESFPDTISRLDFYKSLSLIVAQIGDAHTYTTYPKELKYYKSKKGLLLPIAVRMSDEQLLIKADYSNNEAIDIGDELIGINGITADSLFKEIKMRKSGSEIWREYSAAKHFASWAWILGVREPYMVDIVKEISGDTISIHLIGKDEKILSKERKTKKNKTPNYSYKHLKSNIGYIDFRLMRNQNDESFNSFLKKTFYSIKENPIDGLIIDMRKNGGGDSRMGNSLIGFIYARPYKYAGRSEWKSSEQFRSYLKKLFLPKWIRWLPIQLFHPIGWKIWYTQKDQLVNMGSNEVYKPKSNVNRYSGPVYFLIGNNTFSSAMNTVDIIKANKIATLIGEETGGTPNGFGNIYFFTLPNTKLIVGVSASLFTSANGDETWKGGVLPDIELKQDPDDLKKGIDTVLEFTKELIKKNETLRK